jgi:RNA polymerase sigma-70 factor (ECF subfamily)
VRDDDHRLIAVCLRGDEAAANAAFAQLMCRYEERLFNTVFRLMGNQQDAEDVVQETFVNAYQSLASFKGDSQFFTWLYRIAYNTAVSHKRKQKAAVSIEAGRNGEAGIEPADRSEYNQPGSAMSRAEEERRIQRALNQLSPEHRLVLVLKEMEEMKYEEIAVILQVPVGTVRSRLHRARLELREILERDR